MVIPLVPNVRAKSFITIVSPKVESSTLDDVDNLKEELNLLTKELKNRYGPKDTTETDSQEA